MAEHVVKKDGTKEPFDAAKIRQAITLAAQEAGKEIDQRLIDRVTQPALNFAEDRQEVATKELREILLSELEKEAPEIAAAWRAHDQKKGK
ncbi:MAG: ATP cone domain-containing protein [Candidatus Yanofskybacteria bacterium]|nr:ATP cone domain-containing protein [Candidatus Yanofskybacteria bacterium]